VGALRFRDRAAAGFSAVPVAGTTGVADMVAAGAGGGEEEVAAAAEGPEWRAAFFASRAAFSS